MGCILNKNRVKRMNTIFEKEESKMAGYFLPQLQLVIGVWINGHTYWLHNQTEKIITNEKLTVKLKQENIFSKIRNSHICITNHDESEKNVMIVMMHRYLHASKDHLAFISPTEHIIFHLANKKIFLVNGQYEGQAIQQATIQPFWSMNTDYMWSCESKGTLKYQPMAKGIAVSMFTLNLSIPSHETKIAYTWTIQGEAKSELLNVNEALLKNTLAFPLKK
jgi:hypothetical protein